MLNKNFCKFVSLLMVTCLMFCIGFTVMASPPVVTDVKKTKIIEALQNTEYIKDDIGLKNVDFTNLSVGAPIYVYDYINGEFVKSREYFPLIYNNELVAFAIELEATDNLHYQITTQFVSKINDSIPNVFTGFTIIFDDIASYLFFNNSLIKLKDKRQTKFYENQLTDVDLVVNANLYLQDLSVVYPLNYSYASNNSRILTYYECSINRVSQHPYENLCWAASVACIVNYKNSTNLTAYNVATAYFGTTNFDKPMADNVVANILRTTYGLTYTLRSSLPGGGVMLNNIANNYPIYAGFEYTYNNEKGGHAGVIYAININNGYYYVMDPYESSPVIMTYSSSYGYYYYLDPTMNVNMKFDSAICRYWS